MFRVAEHVLPGSRFHRYTRDGQSVVRSSAPYSVPDDVHQHLDFGKTFQVKYLPTGEAEVYLNLLTFCPLTVGGLHRFPRKRQQDFRSYFERKQNHFKAKIHLGVTPSVLRSRYNLSSADVGQAQNNSQAVAQVGHLRISPQHQALHLLRWYDGTIIATVFQFLEQYYSPADLVEFMSLFGSGFQHQNHVDRVVGTQGAGKAGIEASLDVEYIMSTGANIPTWIFTNPGIRGWDSRDGWMGQQVVDYDSG